MKAHPQFPELLQTFFTDRLIHQRQASAHTVASYRDTFRLLLRFAQQQIGRPPTKLTREDLDPHFLGEFLHHLEKDRGICARSRNVRWAAIHSFFQYVALNEPAYGALAQRVLAMPSKRFNRKPIEHLTRPEVEGLLAAPDRATWGGRRDYTLLLTAVQTGLRISELIGLRCEDVTLGAGGSVHCRGKGHKERLRRCGRISWWLCALGCANVPAVLRTLCFPMREVGRSAAMGSSICWPSTLLELESSALRSSRSTLLCMF